VNEQTILIVDDSSTNREVYTLLLEHFGYNVVTAADGWEGVCMARIHHPAVILMDVTMPVMDGIEATEVLKVDTSTRDIPVIGVSALGDPGTLHRALAVGMAGYLTKPAQPRRVLREIERCLEQSGRFLVTPRDSQAEPSGPRVDTH
jgi:two-component system, cell cycle response regulator DivK